jgi:hypothetical protein
MQQAIGDSKAIVDSMADTLATSTAKATEHFKQMADHATTIAERMQRGLGTNPLPMPDPSFGQGINRQ